MSGLYNGMKQIKTLLNGPFTLKTENGIFYRLDDCNGETVGWFATELLAGFALTLLNGACEEEHE